MSVQVGGGEYQAQEESSLPPPHKHIQWILNWLGDYIQTSKRSTIKMQMGEERKKSNTGSKPNGNGNEMPKTLNNFYTMAEQRIQTEPVDKCIFCEGKSLDARKLGATASTTKGYTVVISSRSDNHSAKSHLKQTEQLII